MSTRGPETAAREAEKSLARLPASLRSERHGHQRASPLGGEQMYGVWRTRLHRFHRQMSGGMITAAGLAGGPQKAVVLGTKAPGSSGRCFAVQQYRSIAFAMGRRGGPAVSLLPGKPIDH